MTENQLVLVEDRQIAYRVELGTVTVSTVLWAVLEDGFETRESAEAALYQWSLTHAGPLRIRGGVGADEIVAVDWSQE